jgi:hypothetical protein
LLGFAFTVFKIPFLPISGPKKSISTPFGELKMPTKFVPDNTLPLWLEAFLINDGVQNLFSRFLGKICHFEKNMEKIISAFES